MSGNARERAWQRLTIQLWVESLHDLRLAVVVRQGIEGPLAMLTSMIRRAVTRGELIDHLNEEATARVLIALFQRAWEPSLDKEACANVAAMLIDTTAWSPNRGRPPLRTPKSRARKAKTQ